MSVSRVFITSAHIFIIMFLVRIFLVDFAGLTALPCGYIPQIRKREEADPERYFLLRVVLVKLKVTLGGKCFASAA